MKLLEKPTQFLSTVQVGITATGILNGIVGEAAFSAGVAQWLASLGVTAGVAGIAATAIVNSLKVRVAELLVARDALPPVITRSSVVGADRSRDLFDQAYREHARRIACAIGQRPGGD